MPIKHAGMLERRASTCPRELLAQDDGAADIQADEVETVLADVDAKGRQRAEAELWAWLRSSCWGAPDEGCAGKHGRSIPLAAIQKGQLFGTLKRLGRLPGSLPIQQETENGREGSEGSLFAPA
jgi:hypothetical protein